MLKNRALDYYTCVLIWVARVLLPSAATEGDRFVLVCTVLTVTLALLLWFFSGIPAVLAPRSSRFGT